MQQADGVWVQKVMSIVEIGDTEGGVRNIVLWRVSMGISIKALSQLSSIHSLSRRNVNKARMAHMHTVPKQSER